MDSRGEARLAGNSEAAAWWRQVDPRSGEKLLTLIRVPAKRLPELVDRAAWLIRLRDNRFAPRRVGVHLLLRDAANFVSDAVLAWRPSHAELTRQRRLKMRHRDSCHRRKDEEVIDWDVKTQEWDATLGGKLVPAEPLQSF